MHNSKKEKKLAQVDVSEADGQGSCLGIGARIAPAVALLLMGESALADTSTDTDDLGGDTFIVPEPSLLSLLTVGAVVIGAAKYVQNKRRK